jgi:hypothetical protein
MNGRILAMDKSIHEKVQTLLPWFVVGTLTGEELDLVNRHLHICKECQSDFTWQCKLQATPPEDEVALDVDQAFAKLLPRLMPIQTKAAKTAKAQRRSLWESISHLWRGNSHWMQWALAGQLVAIVGLTVLLASSYHDVSTYRALGANVNANGNMVVVFKPDTSEMELRHILRNADARIVNGPTVTDAYLLNIPDAKLNKSLHDLRTNQAVVLAESLGSGGTR